MNMKIGIVGPGAMGTFLAGTLNRENDVLLLGRQMGLVEDIKISGNTDIKTGVRYTDDAGELRDKELVILCTKSYDTRQAMEEISPHLNEAAYVLSLQNGLKNEEIVSEFVSKNRVIGGITSHGFLYVEPGKVVHTGKGKTVIGVYPKGMNEHLENIQRILNHAGLDVELTDNIQGHIWKKVIINSGINPITALTGLKNGEILERSYIKNLLTMICRESMAIARTEVALPGGDPVKEAEQVAASTAENRSSMLQDVEHERRTEIDCINGAVIEVGKKNGVETHYNKIFYELVKARESGYL